MNQIEIDCTKCGRHYEEDCATDAKDILDALNETGFCCEYCAEDNGADQAAA